MSQKRLVRLLASGGAAATLTLASLAAIPAAAAFACGAGGCGGGVSHWGGEHHQSPCAHLHQEHPNWPSCGEPEEPTPTETPTPTPTPSAPTGGTGGGPALPATGLAEV